MPPFTLRGVKSSRGYGSALEPKLPGRENGAMPIAHKTLHRRLQRTFEALGVTQAEISRSTGISHSRLSQYLDPKYKRPITLGAASKLCDAYGLTLDWIFRADPSKLPRDLHEKLASSEVA